MKTEIVSPTHANLERAASLLKEGEIIGLPTETVYGLASSAFTESAILKIFKAKQRPQFNPLIVHVANDLLKTPENKVGSLEALHIVNLSQLSLEVKARAKSLLQAFWPGPFTLVLPRHPHIPDLVTAGMDTVAVRMPRHPVAQTLIAMAGVPLAAPSANRFGRISPTTAQDVERELGGKVPLILDGGPCQVGLESTVLHLSTHGELTLLRRGAISVEQIQAVTQKIVQVSESPTIPEHAPRSPGMLLSHYAPEKKFSLLARPIELSTKDDLAHFFSVLVPKKSKNLGIIVWYGNSDHLNILHEKLHQAAPQKTFQLVSLSPSLSAEEAAKNLFSTLRKLDNSPLLDAIIGEATPAHSPHGLELAILDRLTRAATRPDSAIH